VTIHGLDLGRVSPPLRAPGCILVRLPLAGSGRGCAVTEKRGDIEAAGRQSFEQEAKIADLRKEYRPEGQEAGKELAAGVKEEVEKVHSAVRRFHVKRL
jgi:hypothetical protein